MHRLLRRIVESFGFKVVKLEQGKHYRISTECGRTFIAPVTPSDIHWENNFRRDIKKAAKERDFAGLLPADVSRCVGLLNRAFEVLGVCQNCRRRTDDAHPRQVYMLPPIGLTNDGECRYKIDPEE